MSPRPIMDPSKAPMAALTMVYKDYDLLRNWVTYYSRHFDRRHLYILSHGGDPEHEKIAEGANYIRIPRDESLTKLERGRWFLLTNFTNGLLRYYNWVICTDVDEIVIVDPDQSDNLVEYVGRYEGPGTPKSLSPFGIEIVHNPDLEQSSLKDSGTILQKRRLFRLNANYAKPCVVRAHVGFTIGGHANNHQPRYLDPHLYLLHLRFYDFDLSYKRLSERATMRKDVYEGVEKAQTDPWTQGIEVYKALSSQKPVATTIDFPEFRKKMINEAQDLHNGRITFFGGKRSKELYRLPDRFADLF